MTTKGCITQLIVALVSLSKRGDVVAQLGVNKTVRGHMDLLVSADVRRNGPHTSVTIKRKNGRRTKKIARSATSALVIV